MSNEESVPAREEEPLPLRLLDVIADMRYADAVPHVRELLNLACAAAERQLAAELVSEATTNAHITAEEAGGREARLEYAEAQLYERIVELARKVGVTG